MDDAVTKFSITDNQVTNWFDDVLTIASSFIKMFFTLAVIVTYSV